MREYVAHDKVPTVSLATNNAGRSRLSMTFDCALSQHAFALALASDAEHNGQKAANVVLDGVRSVFGPHTMIAPTGVAANGERVISTKRMKPEELAKVKRDIAVAKVSATGGLGMVGVQSGHSASAPKEQKKSDADAADESDDSSHRAAHPENESDKGDDRISKTGSGDAQTENVSSQRVDTATNAFASVLPHNGGSSSNPSTMGPGSQNPMDADYDPWMNPLPTPGSRNATDSNPTDRKTGRVPGAAASQDFDGHGAGLPSSADESENRPAEHHKKHIAVPDISDGIDPWATPRTGRRLTIPTLA
ncbi:hypothetical protein OZX74_07445 [Bifidobacterium sp. ESL0798]|uniref:hypothetical protein n=1 Tax=Bifidobacterium sp. ESL0798 TaxID=2983235 RepID=UPI0023F93813|nr:hypothetical protein [Bifidobacterium sp. ESL0798]WEV73724.1 hypothetical protein OZX74_07445 [Bifidobacterium sp. ESL0798]